ncbi:MAG: hypothetical protein CTY33_05895 [Methylotenera sp.]|nr:MAG: hypothetical protein CTY33_05895 [Methylotenera sp.]
MVTNGLKGAFIGRKTKGWETQLEKELYNEMWNISEWTTVCSPFEEVILGEMKKLNRLNIHTKRKYNARFTDIGAIITVTKSDSDDNDSSTIGEYLILYPI